MAKNFGHCGVVDLYACVARVPPLRRASCMGIYGIRLDATSEPRYVCSDNMVRLCSDAVPTLNIQEAQWICSVDDVPHGIRPCSNRTGIR